MRMNKLGRLQSRPNRRVASATAPTGLQRLGIDSPRDGLYYVPTCYEHKRPAPLIVMLHDAGGAAMDSIVPLQEHADRTGTILLAIESRGSTWDMVLSGMGIDVDFLDRALAKIFLLYSIDADHMAIAGFSDGASYALTLGVTNGEFFTHILAFSPGHLAPLSFHNSPKVFIAHGMRDEVLPAEATSRRLVPALKNVGMDVKYEEFPEGHIIPTLVVRKAFDWMLWGEESEKKRVKIGAEQIGLKAS